MSQAKTTAKLSPAAMEIYQERLAICLADDVAPWRAEQIAMAQACAWDADQQRELSLWGDR